MFLPQPRSHFLPQFLRNANHFLQFLIRYVPCGIVACGIPFFREDPDLLNQAGIGLYGQFQRFNCLQMVSQLHDCAIAARTQSNIRDSTCGVECGFEAAVLRDSLNSRVIEVTAHDFQADPQSRRGSSAQPLAIQTQPISPSSSGSPMRITFSPRMTDFKK
jgi:hypothetical protein